MSEFNQLGSDDPAALQRQIEAEQGPPEEVDHLGRPIQPDDDFHPEDDYTEEEWYKLWNPEADDENEDWAKEAPTSVEQLAEK